MPKLNVRVQDGVAKMDHSKTVANLAGVESRSVRRWVKAFCKDGAFVVPKRQFNKREPHSYIDDEARGGLKTKAERDEAEAKALAGANECRSFSQKKTRSVFDEWKKKKLAMAEEAKEKEAKNLAMAGGREEKEAENDVL